METIRDEKLKGILQELTGLLQQVYGDRLKSIILYGSVARGTQEKGSDIDIMVLVDGDEAELRKYEERLCDVSTDIAVKYVEVLSVIDVSYQEFNAWRELSPFYRNVSEEGIVLYAA